MKRTISSLVLFLLPVFAQKADDLKPWIFPAKPISRFSYCKVYSSEKDLNGALDQLGVQLPQNKSLNIQWSAGSLAVAVFTIGGDEPTVIGAGQRYGATMVVVESREAKDQNPKLFVVETNRKDLWDAAKGGCFYHSITDRERRLAACLSSGASNCGEFKK